MSELESLKIQLVKQFYEGFNRNDVSRLDCLSEDWEGIPAAPGQSPGREGMKKLVTGYLTMFEGLNVKWEDCIESENKVVVRNTITAKHVGEFCGIPGSGQRISMMCIDIHEIKNGYIVKSWHVEDWLSGFIQIGHLKG